MCLFESRSLSTITSSLIPRGQPCCVRHHKNTHLVGTIEPAHASFLSAANWKLRCMCLLQLALTDVRYWHKADISREMCHVCFYWKSARRGIGSARVEKEAEGH